MNVQQAQFTVADYCNGMQDGSIVVNKEYQRSAKVWPPAARSFLIESLLLEYPIPKLSLRQVTDVKSKKTRKEIVDGQQRSNAILDFSEDKFAITRKGAPESISGRRYSELDDDYKQRFLNYGLATDLFVGASDEEIREVFRRINSYTVPLNAEEKRHAEFQGDFKWFIHRLTSTYSQSLINLDVFRERQLSRLQDAKLFCDITYAVIFGIQTTKAPELNRIYKQFDDDFPAESEMVERFRETFDLLVTLPSIPRSSLTKPHQFYSLFLAATHAIRPAPELRHAYERSAPLAIDRDLANSNLSILAEALETDNTEFEEFVSAGAEKTNVADPRVKRFRWYSRALEPRALNATGS